MGGIFCCWITINITALSIAIFNGKCDHANSCYFTYI